MTGPSSQAVAGCLACSLLAARGDWQACGDHTCEASYLDVQPDMIDHESFCELATGHEATTTTPTPRRRGKGSHLMTPTPDARPSSPYDVLERAALPSMIDGQISVLCASETAWAFQGMYATRDAAERAAKRMEGPDTAGYIVAQYEGRRYVFLDRNTLLGSVLAEPARGSNDE